MKDNTEDCIHITGYINGSQVTRHDGSTPREGLAVFKHCPLCGIDIEGDRKRKAEESRNTNQRFKCICCNKSSKLSAYRYITTYSTYTGGYETTYTEDKAECKIVCPKCNMANRLLSGYESALFEKVQKFTGEYAAYYTQYHTSDGTNGEFYENGVSIFDTDEPCACPYKDWANNL